MFSVFLNDLQCDEIKPQRDDNQRQCQGECRQRLSGFKFLVTNKNGNDLSGYRRHRVHRVQLHVASKAGRHHHNHRLADGTGHGKKHRRDNTRKRSWKDHLADRLTLRAAKTVGGIA